MHSGIDKDGIYQRETTFMISCLLSFKLFSFEKKKKWCTIKGRTCSINNLKFSITKNKIKNVVKAGTCIWQRVKTHHMIFSQWCCMMYKANLHYFMYLLTVPNLLSIHFCPRVARIKSLSLWYSNYGMADQNLQGLFVVSISFLVADACGENLAWFFGITTPKYQSAIDEFYRLKAEVGHCHLQGILVIMPGSILWDFVCSLRFWC